MKLLVYRVDPEEVQGHRLHWCVSWTGDDQAALLRTIIEYSSKGYFCRVVMLP